MAITAVSSNAILDSTAIGRDLITAATVAAAHATLDMEDTEFTFSLNQNFSAGLTTAAITSATNLVTTLPTGGQLQYYYGANPIYLASATEFRPAEAGTSVTLGSATREWTNVYSVDGTFSGTVTAPTVAPVSGGSLTLGESDTKLTVAPASDQVIVKTGNANHVIFNATATSWYQDMLPNVSAAPTMGRDAYRWAEIYGVGGSFSGNLNVEVGGTQRVYNLGSEGDVDTEYLETSYAANVATIETKSTGAGGNRNLYVRSAGSHRVYAQGSLVWNNTALISELYTNLKPQSDGVKYCGQDGNRWSSVASVDGSFSGQLDVEAAGSQKYFNLGQQGDTDTEYLEQTWTGNVCKYRALATGTGSVRRIDFEGSGIRFTAAGVAIADVSGGDLRLYSGRTIRPLLDNDASVGKSGQRFTNVYSYAGSFSGNLNVESGGSQRVYGLGTEGDTDTHYLQTNWDGSFYRIGAKATGVGGNKSLMLDYGGSSRLFLSSSEVRIYKYLRPSDTTIDIGSAANPFRTVYSVDGSFSGNLNTEVGGSQRVYNLGTDGDIDTEYLETSWDTNYAYIQNKATGAGVARGIKLMTDNATDGLEINNGSIQLFVSNDAKMQILGSSVTSVHLNPKTSSTYSLGNASNRWQTTVTNGLAVGVQTVSVASPSALNAGKGVTLCDCTATPITVTMPAAATLAGQMLWIKKIDASANTVTIDGNGSETIDGALTITITAQYESVTLVSDGTNWFIV